MTHISFQQLLDLIENRLSATETDQIEAHLAVCQTCRLEQERVQQLIASLQAAELVAPPPHLVQQALSAFQHKQNRPVKVTEKLAQLQFDSRTRAIMPGLRGTIQDYQLLFTVGNIDLDVQIAQQSGDDIFILRGQILNRTTDISGLEGIELQLTSEGGLQRRGLTDNLGRFNFSSLYKGVYALRVIFDEYDVLLQPLVLSPN